MTGEPNFNKTFTPIFSTDLEAFSLDVGPGFPINPDQGYIRDFSYGVPYGFDTMELMLSSTMAYSGDNNLIITAGQRVFVDGRWFRVAPADATDFDYQTTGAASNQAKLYAEEKERIFIALAQSQGRGNENSTGGDQSVLQGIMFWNNDISQSTGGHQEASYITPGDEWVQAQFGTAPLNIVANDDGWANNIYLQMAKSLKNDHGVKRIYIYSIAVGGTDIENFILPATLAANGWTLTATKNLTDILYGANGIRAAIDAIPGRAGAIADAVILVHGGANAIEMPEIQARKMKALFDDLVSEGLANANRTPFLTSMLTTYGDREFDVSRHLTALRVLQWTMPTARIIETVGIATADGLHFTGDGMSEWGNRAAAALFAPPKIHDIDATSQITTSVNDGLLAFTSRATVMASTPAEAPWKPTFNWPNIGVVDGVTAGWVFKVPAATETQVLVRRKTWRTLIKNKLVLDFMASSVGSVHMDFRLYCWDADMVLIGETVINFNDAALISSSGNIKYLRATIYPENLGALIPNGDNKACLPAGTEYFTWGIGAGSVAASETRFLPRNMGEQFVVMTDDEISGFGPITTTTLTIASGEIKPTSRFHRVDTEGAASDDDVTDIDLSDVPEGASVTLQSVQAVRNVTFKHDVGNIRCGFDRKLNNPMDSITFTKRIFGGTAYAAMTAFSDNQGTGSGAPTVYSFTSRTAFIAALGWPWAVGAVVSDGAVQYEYLGTGTAISDMPGWVPFGAITPDHWKENTVPLTTDMASAVQAAGDYAVTIAQAYTGGVGGGANRNSAARVDFLPNGYFMGSGVKWGSGVQRMEFHGNGALIHTNVDGYLFRRGDDVVFDSADSAGSTAHYSDYFGGFVFRNTNLTAANSTCLQLGRSAQARIMNNQFWDFNVSIDIFACIQTMIRTNGFFIRGRTITSRASLRVQGVYDSTRDNSPSAGISFFGNDISGDPDEVDNLLSAILILSTDGFYWGQNHIANCKTHLELAPTGSTDNYKNNEISDILSSGANYLDDAGTGPQILIGGTVAYDPLVTGSGTRILGQYTRVILSASDKIRGDGLAANGVRVSITEGSLVANSYIPARSMPEIRIAGHLSQHVSVAIKIDGPPSSKMPVDCSINNLNNWDGNRGNQVTPTLLAAQGGRIDIGDDVRVADERYPTTSLISYNGDGSTGLGFSLSVGSINAVASTYTSADPVSVSNASDIPVSIGNIQERTAKGRWINRKWGVTVAGAGPSVPITYAMPSTLSMYAIRFVAVGDSTDAGTGNIYAHVEENMVVRRDGATSAIMRKTTTHRDLSVGWTLNGYPAALVLLTGTAWAGSTAYALGDVRTNGGNVYLCVVAGTSAASGGLSGTTGLITDNTVTWVYCGAVSANTLAVVTSGVSGFDMRWSGVIEMIGV